MATGDFLIPGGDYIPGNTYAKNTLVEASGWLVASTTETNENPVPQNIGDPTYNMPDDGTGFVEENNLSSVFSGHVYTFSETGYLKALRIRVPEITADTEYRVCVQNESDPDNITYRIIPTPTLTTGQWVVIAAGNTFVNVGSKLRVFLDSVTSSSDTIINGTWRKTSESDSSPPGGQQWNTNVAKNLLRINKFDILNTDRSSDLNQVGVNTVVRFEQQSDVSRYQEFLIISEATIIGDDYTFTVIEQQIGNGGPGSGQNCNTTYTIPDVSGTKYLELPDHWLTNTPSYATVEGFLEYDGVAQPGVVDNGYSVDIEFQRADVPTDWDFYAFTDSVIGLTSVASGAAAGTVTPMEARRSRVEVYGDDSLPPTQPDGYSYLKGDTEYFFQNGITFSKNLRVSEEGTSLLGTGPFGPPGAPTFTGTGTIITVENFSLSADKFKVNIGTGTQFLSASGASTNTIFMDSCGFNGAGKLGTLDGYSLVLNNFVGFLNSDGWTFLNGPIRGITLVNCFMLDDFQPASTAVHFNLGNATFLDFELQNIVLDGTGTILKSTATVGGTDNMSGDVEADVIGCTLGQGFLTVFDGFADDFQTNKWKFRDNSPISTSEDTKYECDMYLITQNTVSVGVIGTFYEIGNPSAGSWMSDIGKHFTIDPLGFIEYTGDRPIDVEVIGTTTIEKVGGGSDVLEARVAVNWTAGDTGEEKSKAITQNNTPTAVTSTALVTLQPGDNVRLIYANNDSVSNIIVDTTKLELIGR